MSTPRLRRVSTIKLARHARAIRAELQRRALYHAMHLPPEKTS